MRSLLFTGVVTALFTVLGQMLASFGRRNAFRRIAREHGYDVCPSCDNGMSPAQVAERCPECGMQRETSP